MQYRSFGRLDWKASALGFGCMRFPTPDGNRLSANIDEAESLRMVRHAIDNGVNYLDTAYVYHEGQSEVLLHALNRNRWREIVLKHYLLTRAEVALADGRIGQLGFSFHDEYEAFEEIVNGSDLWSFCQIQYNYMDTENQAGTRGLKLAASKGLAVVVMEPLMGGRLADPPKDVREVMESFPLRRSPVEWALEWLWDQPEVSVVLSGMSTMTQVEENLSSADRARIGSFSPAEQALIAEVKEKYSKRIAIPCSKCNYCMPCPNGLNIPANFEFFNYAHLYDNVADARFRYGLFLTESQRASACIACGLCEEMCPQGIAISEQMAKVAALLG